MTQFIRTDFKHANDVTSTYYNLATLASAAFATDPSNNQRTGDLLFTGNVKLHVVGNTAELIENSIKKLIPV